MTRTIWSTWVLIGLLVVIMVLAFLAPPDPMRHVAFMVIAITFAAFEHFHLDRVIKEQKKEERFVELLTALNDGIRKLEGRMDQVETLVSLKRGFSKK